MVLSLPRDIIPATSHLGCHLPPEVSHPLRLLRSSSPCQHAPGWDLPQPMFPDHHHRGGIEFAIAHELAAHGLAGGLV